MRIFKTRWFDTFCRRQHIADATLVEAVERANRGLIDAQLGLGLIKMRLARPGSGRSGGYRTIVAFRAMDRAIFVYGFAKNAKETLEPNELKTYREAAPLLLSLSETQITAQLTAGHWTEVEIHDPNLQE